MNRALISQYIQAIAKNEGYSVAEENIPRSIDTVLRHFEVHGEVEVAVLVLEAPISVIKKGSEYWLELAEAAISLAAETASQVFNLNPHYVRPAVKGTFNHINVQARKNTAQRYAASVLRSISCSHNLQTQVTEP